MNRTGIWPRILVTAGFIAMLVGAIDPMEGSLLIFPGSGLVALGTYLGDSERRLRVFRLLVFVLITVGVAALFAGTLAGGFGGPSGLSIWWGLIALVYPIGWSIGVWGPDSPRWVLWSGTVVGLWYVAIPTIMMHLEDTTQTDETDAVGALIGIFIGAIGVLTTAGCIYRLIRPARD